VRLCQPNNGKFEHASAAARASDRAAQEPALRTYAVAMPKWDGLKPLPDHVLVPLLRADKAVTASLVVIRVPTECTNPVLVVRYWRRFPGSRARVTEVAEPRRAVCAPGLFVATNTTGWLMIGVRAARKRWPSARRSTACPTTRGTSRRDTNDISHCRLGVNTDVCRGWLRRWFGVFLSL
jgi:hypothetical protein